MDVGGAHRGRPAGAGAWQVGILLMTGFLVIAFSSIVEPLRAANWLIGNKRDQRHLLSPTGGLVLTSNDLGIVTGHSGQADAARSMEAAAAH